MALKMSIAKNASATLTTRKCSARFAERKEKRRKMAELENILKKHLKWLKGKDGGERADLSVADLRGADLYGADLSGADLDGAKIPIEFVEKFFPICCPEYGGFIGWKKANKYIVKLLICEDAKRSSAYGRKCRCDKAVVLAIETLDGKNDGLTEIASDYDKTFVYKVGETVSVKDFDNDRRNECAKGIHFFITRQEAVDY